MNSIDGRDSGGLNAPVAGCEDVERALRLLPRHDPGPDFAAKVMARVRTSARLRAAAAPKPPWRRLLDWLRTPQSLSFTPLQAGLAAACLVLVVGMGARLLPDGAGLPGGRADGLTPVQFALAAPGAQRVAVIGSFNNWNGTGWEMRRDPATGIWSLSTALPSGSFEYVFLVDGAATLPDPAAPQSADDGFGSRNSLLLVRGENGTRI